MHTTCPTRPQSVKCQVLGRWTATPSESNANKTPPIVPRTLALSRHQSTMGCCRSADWCADPTPCTTIQTRCRHGAVHFQPCRPIHMEGKRPTQQLIQVPLQNILSNPQVFLRKAHATHGLKITKHARQKPNVRQRGQIADGRRDAAIQHVFSQVQVPANAHQERERETKHAHSGSMSTSCPRGLSGNTRITKPFIELCTG